MPRFEIKVTQRPNIKVPAFSAPQMHEIGDFAIEVMKERNAEGIDVFDRPAKPLQPKYAQRKAKKGLPAKRDLRYTGNMLGSVQVTEADEQQVKVSIKGSPQYRKGIVNQNIDPWFGLSQHDDNRVLDEKVRPLFNQNVADALK